MSTQTMFAYYQKGTILKVTAWTDNTAAKASNRNRTSGSAQGDHAGRRDGARLGGRAYMKEDDFKVEVDKRKAMQSQSTQQQQQ